MATPEVDATRRLLFDAVDRMVAGTQGIDAAALQWRPSAPEANSLAAIVGHALGALEQNVIQSLALLHEVERDREAEFAAVGHTSEAIAAHCATLRPQLDAALEALTAADLDDQRPHPRFGAMDGHELLARAVTHMYEHAAHVELTRQLLDARE